MDPTNEPAAPGPGAALADNLAAQGADRVEQLVILLRDKTVRPLTLATRAIVFGIIVLAAAVVSLTLVAVAVVRLLTVYAFDGRVWLSDVVVGGIFVVLGVVAWAYRTGSAARSRS